MDYFEVIEKIKPSIAFILCKEKETGNESSGSGFVFWQNDIIVTCKHVVEGNNKIFVKFPNSSEYIPAEKLIQDDEHDLALIKFNNGGKTPLILASNKSIKEGMPVIFAGYPFGSYNLTTHQGIISAIMKDPTGLTSYSIDGTVNRGNSGCPLMNEKGEVMGVINAQRREKNKLLEKLENTQIGAISLHGTDVIEIFQAIIRNLQLGIGYAVPASYIPPHKVIEESKKQDAQQ